MFRRILITVISSALYGSLMKIVFKMRNGKTTVKGVAPEETIIQVNRLFYKYLLINLVIYTPIGIVAFFAMLMFIAESDKQNVIYTSVVFLCSVVMFIIWLNMKNKKIRISEKGIWTQTLLRKKRFYFCPEIGYVLVTERKIKLLLGSSKKRITITALYDNYEVLLKWLEMNCKEIRRI